MGAEPTVREAAEALIHALDRWEKTEPNYNDRLALATALPVLKRAMEAFPSAPDRRQAKAAHRMACAALGIEHE